VLAHPLDNPIWHALIGPHRSLAIRNGEAARYAVDVSLFAGLSAATTDALADLVPLVPPKDFVLLLDVAAIPNLGAEWRAADPLPVVQMVLEKPLAPSRLEFETLGVRDVDDMMALVDRTQPGPFKRETISMGRYVGLRDEGRLVAMAGERMKLPGHVEVSGVCTDPDFQGRGLAEALVRTIGSEIQTEGHVPFLHVLEDNERAIALYERLGFQRRALRAVTPLIRL
jgi:predicted GNAT family acetyltransferase